MISFWIAALLLFLLTAAVTLFHFKHRAHIEADDIEHQVNKSAAKQQLLELDALYKDNKLSQKAYEKQKQDLLAKFQLDSKSEHSAPLSGSVYFPLVLLLLTLIAVITSWLYFNEGNYHQQKLWLQLAAINSDEQIEQKILNNPQLKEQQKANQLIMLLRTRAMQQPDQIQHWQVLAGTLASMGAMDQAEQAMQKVFALQPDNSDLRLNWVQQLFESRSQAAIELAMQHLETLLAQQPEHETATIMKAFAHNWLGEYQQAITIWRSILHNRQASESLTKLLEDNIARAQAKLKQSQRRISQESTAAGVQIKVQLEINKELSASLPESATVFVVARIVNGGMPLAVKRLAVNQLPAEVILSEADAMTPTNTLADHQEVDLVVRVENQASLSDSEPVVRIEKKSIAVNAESAHTFKIK